MRTVVWLRVSGSVFWLWVYGSEDRPGTFMFYVRVGRETGLGHGPVVGTGVYSPSMISVSEFRTVPGPTREVGVEGLVRDTGV